jgi:hypothetical protein
MLVWGVEREAGHERIHTQDRQCSYRGRGRGMSGCARVRGVSDLGIIHAKRGVARSKECGGSGNRGAAGRAAGEQEWARVFVGVGIHSCVSGGRSF